MPSRKGLDLARAIIYGAAAFFALFFIVQITLTFVGWVQVMSINEVNKIVEDIRDKTNNACAKDIQEETVEYKIPSEAVSMTIIDDYKETETAQPMGAYVVVYKHQESPKTYPTICEKIESNKKEMTGGRTYKITFTPQVRENTVKLTIN